MLRIAVLVVRELFQQLICIRSILFVNTFYCTTLFLQLNRLDLVTVEQR